jgi:hypothetical protein
MNKILGFIIKNKILVLIIAVVIIGIVIFLLLRAPSSNNDSFLNLENARQQQIETDVLTNRKVNP